MQKDLPFVSVIIPCRNETNHIENLLNSILEQDYPKEKYEVIVADGMSTDGTRDKIKNFIKNNNKFTLIDNPKKQVPPAMNKAIKASNGEVIIRLDVHSIYPKNYFSTLVKVLLETNADNVGAMWSTTPGAKTIIAKAIALAISHPFGVGDATYRLNISQTEPFEVDTVPFGCFRKSLFDRIGYYDEELSRNQDNEFNERILKNGGKIILIPTLKIKYFARENYLKLWKMFYQYGLYMPLVEKKTNKPTNIRRYIPSIFVLSLIIPLIVDLFKSQTRYLTYLSIALHSLASFFSALHISIKEKNVLLLPFIWIAFIISHLSYGIGYLSGFRLKESKKANKIDLNISR